MNLTVTTNQNLSNKNAKNKEKGIQPQKKDHKEESKKRNKQELQKQPENSKQNSNRYIPIGNYLRCKWSKCYRKKDTG